MSVLCGALKNLWYNFYNTCFASLDMSLRYTIGVFLLVASMIFFILSTKGGKKGDMIGNWFWFWISMIAFIIAILYMTI